jgi:hypothetical protein
MDISQLQNRPKDGSFDIEAYERSRELKPNHGKVIKESKQVDSWSD